ncbi:hypothetical protein ACHAWT_000016, partial [Skeletonema menzelii]
MPTSEVESFEIDGNLTTWEDMKTCGIPMHEAGNITKALASLAYINWDCSIGKLCILVEAVGGFELLTGDDDSGMWLKIYSGNNANANAEQNPISGSVTTIDTNGTIIAWEACYEVESTLHACLREVEIHSSYDYINATDARSRSSSTGK